MTIFVEIIYHLKPNIIFFHSILLSKALVITYWQWNSSCAQHYTNDMIL